MTKYTINKLFEKEFPHVVWKIEVDSEKNFLSIECRNPENTLPYFHVLTFDGVVLLDNYAVHEKEWTIAAIQDRFLILKKYGSASPIQPGIIIIDVYTRAIVCRYDEYIYEDTYENYLIARHRTIPSGLTYYLEIKSGEIGTIKPFKLILPENHLRLPIPYNGKMPIFMESIDFVDQIWLQKHNQNFLWSYHSKNNKCYQLNLILSTNSEIIDQKMILDGMVKLIPQPYFMVKDYIFFLSSNKMKITTYLV